MNYLTIAIVTFSVLGSLDRIFGNKFGLGKEFEKAFELLSAMALSMIGMIVISPAIANFMKPISDFFVNVLNIDASIIPASLFANDMGGAPLATKLAINKEIGAYNALVVSAMMGVTVSFTIPFALGVVPKEKHDDLFLGLLCGIVTIPFGCIVSGLICKLEISELIIDLIPIVIFSAVIAIGLICAPNLCIRIFKIFGVFIKAVITIGLALGIIRFLTGYEVIKGLATIEEGADICVNAAIVLSGSFPLIYLFSKVLAKPLKTVGDKIGLNETSVVCVVSNLVSSSASFGVMDKMNKKGVVMNSAFAVSGAFVFGSHLAFTLAYNSEYVLPVIVGKLVSGIFALILSYIIFDKMNKQKGDIK